MLCTDFVAFQPSIKGRAYYFDCKGATWQPNCKYEIIYPQKPWLRGIVNFQTDITH